MTMPTKKEDELDSRQDLSKNLHVDYLITEFSSPHDFHCIYSTAQALPILLDMHMYHCLQYNYAACITNLLYHRCGR